MRIFKVPLMVLGMLVCATALAASSPFKTYTTALSAASALGGTEIMVCIQGGNDVKCTPTQIATYVLGGGSFSGSSSGTNTGDQTITLTGAVMGSGTGSFATTYAGLMGANLLTAGNLSAGSWTTAGIGLAIPAATYTDTTGTGTITTEAAYAIGAPTIAASGTATITNEATLYVAQPLAGTGITATNRYSIFTPGPVNFQGSITGGAGATINSGGVTLVNNTNNVVNIGTGTDTSTVTVGGGSNAVTLNATTLTLNATTVTGTATIPAANVAAGTFSGIATAIFGGVVSAPRYSVSGSTAPNNGMYLPAANTLALSANSNLVWANGSTTFTVTGCGTAGSVTGNATTGTFTVGTGAATCTFIVTINGATGLTAPHGWHLDVDDVTAKIHCPNTGSAVTTTGSALCNSTVTTGDVIAVSAVPY